MTNERLALVMLNGEVPNPPDDPNHASQFYKSMAAFENASAKLCEERKFIKLESFFNVAWKLFRDGNETVRNGIVNVYLCILYRVMDAQKRAKINMQSLMHVQLRKEYGQLRYVSGL